MEMASGLGYFELAIEILFLHKCLTMKSGTNWKISFMELSFRNSRILAQQSEISFAQAIQQVQRLKGTSKVNDTSKKSRLS
jgi:hypothetical protein